MVYIVGPLADAIAVMVAMPFGRVGGKGRIGGGLGSFSVVTVPMPGFQVKILVQSGVGKFRHFVPFSLLGALSWSLSVTGHVVRLYSAHLVFSFGNVGMCTCIVWLSRIISCEHS